MILPVLLMSLFVVLVCLVCIVAPLGDDDDI